MYVMCLSQCPELGSKSMLVKRKWTRNWINRSEATRSLPFQSLSPRALLCIVHVVKLTRTNPVATSKQQGIDIPVKRCCNELFSLVCAFELVSFLYIYTLIRCDARQEISPEEVLRMQTGDQAIWSRLYRGKEKERRKRGWLKCKPCDIAKIWSTNQITACEHCLCVVVVLPVTRIYERIVQIYASVASNCIYVSPLITLSTTCIQIHD